MTDSEPPAGTGTSTSRQTLKRELFGPPRQTLAARVCVVVFGLLLVSSLAVSSLSAAEVAPGQSMIMAGLMILCGFAELIDSNHRAFVIALRFGGATTALLGLLLQVL